MPLEKIAAHVHSLMARDTAQRFEQPVAGKFPRRQRTGVAGEPAVRSGCRV